MPFNTSVYNALIFKGLIKINLFKSIKHYVVLRSKIRSSTYDKSVSASFMKGYF